MSDVMPKSSSLNRNNSSVNNQFTFIYVSEMLRSYSQSRQVIMTEM